MRYGTALTTSVILLLVLSAGAFAQKGPATPPVGAKPAAPPAATKPKAQAPAQPQAAKPQVVMPDAEKIVLLLRNTLITLNDAIQTGNFTVLRDRGAPGFRDANSAARLGQIFSSLASPGVDLSVVSVISPQLTEAPALDQDKGMLRLKGYFPGQPVQINFELLYQSVAGHWRLFGLSVQPGNPTPPPQPPPQSVSGNGVGAEDKKP
jgi:hypothetical protein